MHHRDRHLGATRPMSPAASNAAGSSSLPPLPRGAEGRVARRYPHAAHLPPTSAETTRTDADDIDTAAGKPTAVGALFLGLCVVAFVYAVIVAAGSEVLR